MECKCGKCKDCMFRETREANFPVLKHLFETGKLKGNYEDYEDYLKKNK